MTHLSNLCGLADALSILIIGGKVFVFFSPTYSQGLVLQDFSKTASPTQGFPPFLGGSHILYNQLFPPPQIYEHSLQSCKRTHFPLTLAFEFFYSLSYDSDDPPI